MKIPSIKKNQIIKFQIGIFHVASVKNNSNLLYKFYKNPFCRMRFLEHDERSEDCYKAKSATKWLYFKF
jgi:hypothetical protein